MRKFGFLLFLSNLCFCVSLHAQILDDSFSDGFTLWTPVGSPSAGANGNAPSVGGTDAMISSTDDGGGSGYGPGSATAADIESALGITSLPAQDFAYSPFDGQAIFLTHPFTLTSTEELTFSYSYASNDEYPYDSVGYVLNGVYTQIQQSPLPSDSPESATAYVPYPEITLTPGTYNLGFVAFNTPDGNGNTTLYVTDVEVSPEPSTWLLVMCGLPALALLACAARRRALVGCSA
jgi:hypothetical protein